MAVPYLSILAPILSMAILTLGNGLFTTFTCLALQSMQASVPTIGVIAALYFSGLMVGSYWSQRMIIRIGYVRALALFCAATAACTLLQGLFEYVALWGLLRFICGYCLAGLFIVIESWLLASGARETRGRIMAFYLFTYYIAMTLSQLLLDLPFSSHLAVFALIAVLSSLAVIPVCVSRCEAPRPEAPRIISLAYLWRRAPLGVAAGFVSGVALGIVYTVLPLYLAKIGVTTVHIAWVMAATVLGGTVFQLPAGKLSDRFDRRKILVIVSLATFLISMSLLWRYDALAMLVLLGFLLGGFSFTLYPLAINHTNDDLASGETLSALAMLTLVYGVGSALGPILATNAMYQFGATGVFMVLGLVVGALAVYSVWRVTRHSGGSQSSRSHFVPTAPEAPIVNETAITDEPVRAEQT